MRNHIFLRIALGLIIFQFTGCFLFERDLEYLTKEADEVISEEPLYQELEKLCQKIPLPQDSTFLGKEILFNTNKILYFYRSEISFDEALPSFDKYFFEKKWMLYKPNSIGRQIDYRDGKYVVFIEYGNRQSEYTISCGFMSKIEKDQYEEQLESKKKTEIRER